MARTKELSIQVGDLSFTYDTLSNVRIVRQSTMEHITISVSEWGLCLASAQLAGWPVISPIEQSRAIDYALERSEDS
jgi:hypothetical protein